MGTTDFGRRCVLAKLPHQIDVFRWELFFCFPSASCEVGRLKFDEYKSREDLIRRIRIPRSSALPFFFLFFSTVCDFLAAPLCRESLLENFSPFYCDTPGHFFPALWRSPELDFCLRRSSAVTPDPGLTGTEGSLAPLPARLDCHERPSQRKPGWDAFFFVFPFFCRLFNGLAFFTRHRPLETCVKGCSEFSLHSGGKRGGTSQKNTSTFTGWARLLCCLGQSHLSDFDFQADMTVLSFVFSRGELLNRCFGRMDDLAWIPGARKERRD